MKQTLKHAGLLFVFLSSVGIIIWLAVEYNKNHSSKTEYNAPFYLPFSATYSAIRDSYVAKLVAQRGITYKTRTSPFDSMLNKSIELPPVVDGPIGSRLELIEYQKLLIHPTSVGLSAQTQSKCAIISDNQTINSFDDIIALYAGLFASPETLNVWKEDDTFTTIVTHLPYFRPDVATSSDIGSDHICIFANFTQIDTIEKQTGRYAFGTTIHLCKSVNDQADKWPIIIIKTPSLNVSWDNRFDSGNDWLFGKMVALNSVASIIHWDHLAWTHIVMDPIRIASDRQFSNFHPLKRLIHKWFPNQYGFHPSVTNILFNTGGVVDKTLSYTGKSALIMTARSTLYGTWDMFNPFILSPDSKYAYTYTTNAATIRTEMTKLIRSYVDVFYPSEIHLILDTELQSWLSEIKEKTQMINGLLSALRSVNTKNSLTEFLVSIWFTLTVPHNTMNGNVLYKWYSAPLVYYYFTKPPKKGLSSELDILTYIPDVSALCIQLVTNAGFYALPEENEVMHKMYDDLLSYSNIRSLFWDWKNSILKISNDLRNKESTKTLPSFQLDPMSLMGSVPI